MLYRNPPGDAHSHIREMSAEVGCPQRGEQSVLYIGVTKKKRDCENSPFRFTCE